MDRDQLLGPKEEWDFYLGHNNDVHDPRYQNFVRPLVALIESRQHPSHRGLDFGAGSGPVISHASRAGVQHVSLRSIFPPR